METECPRGCGRRGHRLSMGRHAKSCWFPRTLDRLMEIGSVDTSDEGACWPWLEFDLDSQYPHLGPYKVSRLVLSVALGRMPGRWELACHTCDRKGCVNPKHIYCGTDKTNYADAVRNGKAPKQDGAVISLRMKRQWANGAMDSVLGDRVEREELECAYCGCEVRRLRSQCRARVYCSLEHFYAHRRSGYVHPSPGMIR